MAKEVGARKGELGGEGEARNKLCHCFGWVMICYRLTIVL
jgi:hypothetical protein